MKRLLTAIVACTAALLLSVPSYAADLGGSRAHTPDTDTPSYEDGYSWTGFWLGGSVGYGNYGTELEVTAGGTPFATFDGLNGKGGIFGVEAGADYQVGKVVFGASVGYDWNRVKSEVGFGSFSAEVENGNTFYGQARAGVAVIPRGLIFGLARYTWEHEGSEVSWTGGGSYELAKRQGWGIGGGMEYAVTDNLSIKSEYVHTFFDKEEVISGGGFALNEETGADVVKLQANYRF
jgi:outer membrane immunogenic protein